MTNWRPEFNPDHLYFVSTTAVKHRHLFKRDVIKRLIVDVLDCMRLRQRFKLYCFVVMPNHVHLILQCRDDDPFAGVVRDFKKHVADRVIRFYRAEGKQMVLDILASAVTRPEKQHYKVWEDGYNAKAVFSAAFLRQKMEYIHTNPCQSHWQLADNSEAYIWSSARFYLTEEPGIIPLDDVSFMFD